MLPQLVVVRAGSSPETHELRKDEMTIGRSSQNDITISSKIVSRHHARLIRDGKAYSLEILPEATNRVLFEGRPVKQTLLLRHNDKLRIGGSDPGSMITMHYLSPAEAAVGADIQTVEFGEKTQLTIGRDPVNDVILEFPGVSRFHAEVQRIGQRYRLRDLRSYNGTFVNSERVDGDVWLKQEDTIRIGPYRFVLGEKGLP